MTHHCRHGHIHATPEGARACQGLEPLVYSEFPKALDAIADVVLAYRPKPKSQPARKRKRKAAKLAKEK